MATVPNTTPNAIFAFARDFTCMGRECNRVFRPVNGIRSRVVQPFSGCAEPGFGASVQVRGHNDTVRNA
jgi:hypothetical protein